MISRPNSTSIFDMKKKFKRERKKETKPNNNKQTDEKTYYSNTHARSIGINDTS
jgi:hypothetical protein